MFVNIVDIDDANQEHIITVKAIEKENQEGFDTILKINDLGKEDAICVIQDAIEHLRQVLKELEQNNP